MKNARKIQTYSDVPGGAVSKIISDKRRNEKNMTIFSEPQSRDNVKFVINNLSLLFLQKSSFNGNRQLKAILFPVIMKYNEGFKSSADDDGKR